jgi:acetate---CoA ligase (ADP-forming)
MDRFFHAESVAVVGVSNSQGNLGRAMVYNLMEFRYQGCIYLVGPKGGAFAGHKIYSSVLDIPDRVDLATILVPAAAVPKVVAECGEKGIKRVVVQSAGFRELGGDRLVLEEELLKTVERYGMRMIGPNCIGIINRRNGLAVPFMPFKAEAPLGRVAVISQSGGVGAMMLNSLASENIGFSKFASIGNKLNVNEADFVEYLNGDDETDIMFGYLEGIADGRRLMKLACESPKRIVVHKSNNGSSGSVIARSHSASLSSDDAVVDAAFKQCGIIRAREQREAVEIIKGVSLGSMKGNRLAVISRSGGHAVMAADAAEELGFELPPYPEDVIRLVHEQSRAKVIEFHNPMDLGDLFDLGLYKTLAEKTLARDDIDGLLFIHNYQGIFDAEESRRLVVSFGDVLKKYRKPVAVCVFTTQTELLHNRRAVRYPLFTDPREALRALALSRDRATCGPFPFSTERPRALDPAPVRVVLAGTPSGPIPPERLAAILSAYKIPLVGWRKVEGEDDALKAALTLGFPVALKTAEPQVVHKSDEGGVVLDVADEPALRDAYRRLCRLGPSALVQKMSGPGLEWLIGGRRDHQFGPVVVSGLGGVYVEVFKETAIRIGPVGYEEAGRLLDECRGAAFLSGVRGQPPLDRRALMDIIVRISWLLADFPEIRELDLNPVRVMQKGCLVLDWRAGKGAGD